MTLRSFVWLPSLMVRLVALVAISVVVAACRQGGDGGTY